MTRKARLSVLTLALFGLIGLNLFVRLGYDSFRGDEAFAVVFARQPVADVLAAERDFEPNPPIYFMLLKAWMQMAGSSEVAARLPSVLAAWLAAALVYRGGRESLGRMAAVLGMAVFGAMPLVVWYGQDARAYPLLMAFVAALMVCGRRLAIQRGAKWPLAFGFLSALALFTHYFAALFLVAYGLGLFALGDWSARKRLAAAAGGAAVLFGPWLAYVAPLLAGQTRAWIPAQSLGQTLFRWLAGFSAGTTAPEWARWAGRGRRGC